ncbi:hypothetical protein [Nonomuraea sediminis]|uniref:hypothetical protein n=1 Tax=Nonomuraea sediminis TaxID=2835864 RepID=UPI001BDC18BF|nr:hypothetical protein [Nonomuraea sediminis]
MAGHQLIADQLTILAERLPAPAVDELADGLEETYAIHLARTGNPDQAARTAIAEFGDADTITAAFIRDSPSRKTALLLVTIGPLVGLVWGSVLIGSRVWTWAPPLGGRVLYGAVLLAVVATLLLTIREKRAYRRARRAIVGASVGTMVLDGLMVAFALSSHLAWPLIIGVAASLFRMALTAQGLPTVLRS